MLMWRLTELLDAILIIEPVSLRLLNISLYKQHQQINEHINQKQILRAWDLPKNESTFFNHAD